MALRSWFNELVLSSPQIMYHFSIEFLELAVSCLGLGEGGCDCTALAVAVGKDHTGVGLNVSRVFDHHRKY